MNFASLKNQIVGELKASRKKAGLMAVLLIVAAIMGLRLMASGSGEPRRARASGASRKTPSVEPPEDFSMMTDRRERSERASEYLKNLDRTIRRDVFEPSDVYFPVSVEPSRPVDPRPKPATAPAVDQQALLARLIAEQARSLKVETVILSESPTAIINGRVVRAGDYISGFKIVEIGAKGCVVKKDEVRVNLTLQK